MHRLPRAIRLRQQHFVAPRVHNRLVAQRRITTKAAFRSSNGEPARVQTVRFQKPGLTLRRLATIGLYMGTTYAFLNLALQFLDVEIEIMDEEEVAANQKTEAANEEESEYADEESLFIPMTWAKKMPRTWYKGSDPEWQAFKEVSKDKERQKRIQEELVQQVYQGTLKLPIVQAKLGKDAKVGKFWLDITIPDGPPPEFERSGIEIGDGYIAWSKQRITPENQWRVMRALWPKAAFDSIWATTKVLAGINYRRAKQSLGWEEKDPFSPEERYRHALEMMEKQQQSRERKEVGKAQLEPNGSNAVVGGSAAADAQQQSRTLQGDAKKLPWMMQVPMPAPTGIDNKTDVPIALHVFASTLQKQWKPKQQEPPKGTFVVQGLIELKGSNGRLLMDVQSCYDPREHKYVLVSARNRSYKSAVQRPRGGY